MSDKFKKKIKKLKEKRYEYTPIEKLIKTLGLYGKSEHYTTKEDLEKVIKNLRYRESIGEIKGLVIKDLPDYWYIMWDDDSLGEPILIYKKEKIIEEIILDTPEKLIKHYKESEKINLLIIMDDLKKKPLEVFFMDKGGFKYKEDGYKMIWYDFMNKNGKVYTLVMREVDGLKYFADIKMFDIVKFSMINDMLRIRVKIR